MIILRLNSQTPDLLLRGFGLQLVKPYLKPSVLPRIHPIDAGDALFRQVYLFTATVSHDEMANLTLSFDPQHKLPVR